MWNEPSPEQLDAIPRLYETETIPLENKLIHLHFFIGGCDWYAVEFDGEDTFFGYAILNRDWQNAEWGYFSLSELKAITVAGSKSIAKRTGRQSPPVRFPKFRGFHDESTRHGRPSGKPF
ncbi:DUF2958 domain-containing protein [Salidesulfovibrio brasiliensis]|uniref:DUF2958 domain-containing protein n=1 Tax=Salidesulfovibrio brasiliensis TaxID=221711 RepID=UPI000A3E1A7F|nr:DUF2958 domain-containing protein [Salidesulfovibrio brasiliensis]